MLLTTQAAFTSKEIIQGYRGHAISPAKWNVNNQSEGTRVEESVYRTVNKLSFTVCYVNEVGDDDLSLPTNLFLFTTLFRKLANKV